MSITINRTCFELGEYQSRIRDRLANWADQNLVQRLWQKDHTLWSSEPIAELIDRLGWLTLPDTQPDTLDGLVAFADEVRSEGFTHVVLLGMGGSSLAPEVFARCFGSTPGYPELSILDSTHPLAVLSLVERLPLAKTLFCVSSKSGTTLETLSFFRYFWSQKKWLSAKSGRQFLAITDPGSSLEKLAREREFRAVFAAPQNVGGRYSALTVFGLVPAALIGVDIHKLMERARRASKTYRHPGSDENLAGIVLGATLGELFRNRNKITLMTTPSLNSFSDWVEQLVAESTGKDQKGILPIVNEPLIPAGEYSNDRLFVGVFLEEENDGRVENLFDELTELGHPVVRIYLNDKYDLGREFFHWEVAVATAGAVLGINPFDQPDVQLAKNFTNKIMESPEKSPIEDKISQIDNVIRHETIEISDQASVSVALKNWVSQIQPGDYIALQAFLQPNPATVEALQRFRKMLLDYTKLATTLGFGPRFLHSTGQLHKGGPNNGHFLQLVQSPQKDCDIPQMDLSFGQVIHAQAYGDYLALLDRKRRILRVNLGSDVKTGLESLQRSLVR